LRKPAEPDIPGRDQLDPHEQIVTPANAKKRAPAVTATYLRIPNFEIARHYSNRASTPWIKLHDRWLDDYRLSRLPDAQRLHVLLLWMLANRCDNLIPNDPGYIAYKLQVDGDVDVPALVALGFLEPVPAHEVPASRPMDVPGWHRPRQSNHSRQANYSRRLKQKNRAEKAARKAPAGAPTGPGGQETPPEGDSAPEGDDAPLPSRPRRKAGSLLRRFRESEPI